MRAVICGAGTAGCVVAARLSEDPSVDVTLIEAGPHYRRGDRDRARASGGDSIPRPPGCPDGMANLGDDGHLLQTVETFHHPVGSCRMGQHDDPDAVADDRRLCGAPPGPHTT